MYLKFYGLKEPPFSLTPDTQFFLSYGHHRDALSTLTIALESGEGFIKLTGEIGTGKTLLCRKLLNDLDARFYTAYIPNPMLSPESLIRAVADELDIDTDSTNDQHQIMKQISHTLIKMCAGENKKQVLLCIDEAQSMPMETLEMMRLLTNLESEKKKLLQVVLFGQPELDEKLAHKSIRQLKQRITFSYNLEPLDLHGITAYIKHRLLTAGSSGAIQFHPRAIKILQRGSRGYPRLINILAHKSLMLSFAQGTMVITPRHVKAAIKDTEGAYKLRFWLW
ncbi:MAG: AAA family ATPase [Gammaproteobacteria bacterium]|nr:AAA family ATPase [Gammaproteobacteria bacterium]